MAGQEKNTGEFATQPTFCDLYVLMIQPDVHKIPSHVRCQDCFASLCYTHFGWWDKNISESTCSHFSNPVRFMHPPGSPGKVKHVREHEKMCSNCWAWYLAVLWVLWEPGDGRRWPLRNQCGEREIICRFPIKGFSLIIHPYFSGIFPYTWDFPYLKGYPQSIYFNGIFFVNDPAIGVSPFMENPIGLSENREYPQMAKFTDEIIKYRSELEGTLFSEWPTYQNNVKSRSPNLGRPCFFFHSRIWIIDYVFGIR